MNKEEKLQAIKEIKDDSKVLEFVATVLQEKEDVQQELDKYKNRIDRAIEYIKKNKIKISIKRNSEYAIPIEEIENILNKTNKE